MQKKEAPPPHTHTQTQCPVLSYISLSALEKPEFERTPQTDLSLTFINCIHNM